VQRLRSDRRNRFRTRWWLATLSKPTDHSARPSSTHAAGVTRLLSYAPAVALALGISAAAVLLAPRAVYVPMWDGYIYAAAIDDAATAPFSLEALRLGGHASQAYALVAIALQKLAPGSTWPLFLLSVCLLGASAAGFHRLVAIAFPHPELALERALATCAFLLQPSLLAAVVQPGLDLPLVPAFLWCAVMLLERRYVAAIILGLVLAFTKETGLLLYGALVASYVAWRFIQPATNLRERTVRVLRLAPLVVPALVFGAYLLYRKQFAPAGESVVWNAGTQMIGQSLLRQLIVPRIDRYLASYLAIVLVLNFAWIATVGVAAAAATFVARSTRDGWHRAWRSGVESASTVPGLVVIAALVSGYLLTRFATYANSRYLLPLMLLRDVVFLAALLALPLRPTLRRAALGAYALLLTVSAVRTVDPVSRGLYGTFAFGDHRLLRMTSITRECCGAGRDQLVYNLEFTALESLIDEVVESVKPGDSTLIVIPDSTDWFVASRLDRRTGRRTISRANSITPRVVESDVMGSDDSGRRAVYVAMPNASPDLDLRQLSGRFAIGSALQFRDGGYRLSAFPLVPVSPSRMPKASRGECRAQTTGTPADTLRCQSDQSRAWDSLRAIR